MKIWLVVSDKHGICTGLTRGETKQQVEAYLRYATGNHTRGYKVQRFDITPSVRKKRKAKR